MRRERRRAVYGAALSLAAIASLGLAQAGPAAGNSAGDAGRGKILFEKRCTGCHGLDRDKEGPRLGGVYGRKAGSVAGFTYSDALKSAHLTWDDASLDRWLTNTEAVIPNNDMAFRVPSAEERADIVAFLRSTSQPELNP
jgi:cytochrome c